ncbi:unnamed protein product [Lupinus luteus]|uniref:Uncharacterized protein n=1 Tax=Lupinus luteus TaxID=3873 RepID=A0AAV1VZW9_LUPLU
MAFQVSWVPDNALTQRKENIERLSAITAFQLAIVPEIAISPSSSLELFLGPKGNGVTKSSLLLQLDHCSTRWVVEVFSTPAIADVESERWDSRLIGCFR